MTNESQKLPQFCSPSCSILSRCFSISACQILSHIFWQNQPGWVLSEFIDTVVGLPRRLVQCLQTCSISISFCKMLSFLAVKASSDTLVCVDLCVCVHETCSHFQISHMDIQSEAFGENFKAKGHFFFFFFYFSRSLSSVFHMTVFKCSFIVVIVCKKGQMCSCVST